MAHVRPQFFSAAQALCSAFCPSIELRGSQIARSRTVSRNLRYYHAPSRSINPGTATAPFNNGSRSLRPPPQAGPGPRPSRPPKQYGPRVSRGPAVDENIPSNIVQIVGENGSLGDPILLQEALLTFNRAEFSLHQVAPAAEGRHSVCKLINKQKFRENQRAKTKATKVTALSVKRIELNWSIDAHDLSHRLGQMESFLEKGKRVELVLIRKKGKKRATPEQAEKLLQTVREKIAEIKAVEVKPMTGSILKHVEWTLDGKSANS